MKVLIVKMSSMGDILHTLPALTDAQKAIPNIEFDWVVESGFSEIPSWHPAVKTIIPIAFRHLRKNLLTLFFKKEWRDFYRILREQQYDLIIDAQGLLKSAFITRLAKGQRCGFSKKSARESLAALFYDKAFQVSKILHAVTRIRKLFSKALAYHLNTNQIDYGLRSENIQQVPFPLKNNYILFIPNTSWDSKRWPITYWRQLLTKMQKQNQSVVIPSGYTYEQAIIESIAKDFDNVTILPKTTLTNIMQVIAHSKAIVSVDTGLAHLAAALAKPTMTLYGPTDCNVVGTFGKKQIHLSANFTCAPCKQRQCNYQKTSEVMPACYTSIKPDTVFEQLVPLINEKR